MSFQSFAAEFDISAHARLCHFRSPHVISFTRVKPVAPYLFLSETEANDQIKSENKKCPKDTVVDTIYRNESKLQSFLKCLMKHLTLFI